MSKRKIKIILFIIIVIILELLSISLAEDEQTVWEYGLTSGVETYTVPYSGIYQLEVWGGAGGYSVGGNNGGSGTQVVLTQGGKGGYAKGSVYLKKDQKLYVCVGGQGANASRSGGNVAGGYNGGGRGTGDGGDDGPSEGSGGGGGATHIAINTNRGVLSNYSSYRNEILIVAGGGGGASFTYVPGDGGGLSGGITNSTNQSAVNQTTGYAFGKGQDASGVADSDGVGGGRRWLVWRLYE